MSTDTDAITTGTTEAYLGDVIRPVKRHIPEYHAMEDRMARAIAGRFEVESTVAKSFERKFRWHAAGGVTATSSPSSTSTSPTPTIARRRPSV